MDRQRSRDSDDDRGSSRGRYGGRGDDSYSRGGPRDDDDRGSRRGGGGRRFEYHARSADDVKKRSEMGGGDFDSYIIDSLKMFKPADGANTIRILPPTWPDAKHFGLDIWVHFGVGADQQSYLCLHKMKNEPCPICEELQRAQRNREDEEYISSLKPTRRVLYYLIDREHEKDGLMVWAAPQTVDQAILKVSVDRRTGEALQLDHPEEGFDVEFDKTGKGIGTKYLGVAIARRESSLGNDKWLDEAVDKPLTEVLNYYDYDYVARVFGSSGSGPRRSRDDDGDRGGRRDSHSRDRDADDDRSSRRGESSRGRREEHTWESVHALEGAALDKLIEDERLSINPAKAESDEELADWICEALKLDKPTPKRGRDDADDAPRRRRVVDDDAEDDSRDRLRRMRGD